MKRWIALAARLYPGAWQKRYGTEFNALLEEVNPSWRELFDVLGGALKMQLTTGATYWKLGAAFAIAGMLAATVASFVIPKEYVSTAVLRFTDNRDVPAVERHVLSRTSLAEIIQRPTLNLYSSERTTKPLEDVVEYMRSRAIHITVAESRQHVTAITISYSYSDRRKAKAVVEALISSFVETYINLHISGELTSHENIEVVDNASFPTLASGPKRPEMLLEGLTGGLLLGLLFAVFVKHPRRALVVATTGLIGAILGGSLSLLLPDRYVSRAVIRVDNYDGGIEETIARAQRPGLSFHVMYSDPRTIEISYLGTDPRYVQAMVNSVANTLVAESKLRQRNVEYLDYANYPTSPAWPNRYVISSIGLCLGLFFAAIDLFLQNRRRLKRA
jgi:uncharacterized protein involved in exopolysaccharide biosynthesis